MDFDQISPYDLLGINPGGARSSDHGGGGEALPGSDGMLGDNAAVPWHPDSPAFWLGIFALATLLGIVGASLDVRAGRRHASVRVGD